MKKANLVILLTLILSFTLSLNAMNNGIDYDMQLTKFYYSLNEYQLVINHLDSLETHDYLSDSLYFYKASSYSQLGHHTDADSLFCFLIKHSNNEGIVRSSFDQLTLDLPKYNSIVQIDMITSCLSELEYEFIRIDILFVLAKIYENNHLYNEANDVYKSILDETDYQRQREINLMIASNLIFSEQYNKAINLLEPLVVLRDSLITDNALYLCYIAYYSLNDHDSALKALIKIYNDYPTFENRLDIIEKISDIYFLSGDYIMSWYFLEQLRNYSDKNLQIDSKINIIRNLISEEDKIVNPFKDLIFKSSSSQYIQSKK